MKEKRIGFAWIPLIITAVLFFLRATGVATFSWWLVAFPFALYLGIVVLWIILVTISIVILTKKNPEAMMEFRDKLDDEDFVSDPKAIKKFLDEHF